MVFLTYVSNVIKLVCRMGCSEDVQYFQFDKDGNMFVYEPGSGFSGECHLVKPGDDLTFNLSRTNSQFECKASDCVLQCDLLPQVDGDRKCTLETSQVSSRLIIVTFIYIT